MPSRSTLSAFRGTAGVLHAIGLTMACFRVNHRWKRGAFYWDDHLSILATVLDVILFSTLFWKITQTDREMHGIPVVGTEAVASYYIQVLAYFSAVWSGRLSLAFGILRVVPQSVLRIAVICIIIWYGMAWITLVVLQVVFCMKVGVADDGGICVLWRPYLITKLVHDVIANLLLAVTPLYVLWHSRLPQKPRRFIGAIFSSNVLMIAFSVVHMIAQIRSDPLLEGFAAHWEAAVTLITTNLLVISTWIYRTLHIGRGTDSESPTVEVASIGDHGLRSRSSFPSIFTSILTNPSIFTQLTGNSGQPRPDLQKASPTTLTTADLRYA